jgi:hypothetical protein
MYVLFRTLDLAEYYTNHNYGGFKKHAFLNGFNLGACDKMAGTCSPWPPQARLEVSGNRQPRRLYCLWGNDPMPFDCAAG